MLRHAQATGRYYDKAVSGVLRVPAGGGVEAKEAYRRFAELLSWNWAGAPGLLSELVYENVGAAVMAELYDGDPSPLFNLLLDHTASESIRFWQWRTLILLVLRADTADCDDRRLILAADHPIVMRSSSHTPNETSGRRRHA